MTFDQNNFGIEPRRNAQLMPPIDVTAWSLPAQPVSPFNWEQALRIMRKNWKLACTFAALVTCLMAIYAFSLKDTYHAVATLEIDPPGSSALSLRDAEGVIENNQEYLETQAQILHSDELATRVIRDLHLERDAAVVGGKNLVKYGGGPARPSLSGASTAGKTPLQEQFDLAERTPLEAIALRTFRNALSVNIVRGSRLVEVGFNSNNPRLSQQVANKLASQFIDQNFKTRYLTTMQASEWLSSQMNDLRQQVEDSNQAVVDYQKRFGLVEEDEKDGPSVQLMSQVSHQVSEAKADRIQTEAFVRMIDMGQAESLPQVQASQVYQTLTSRYGETSAKLSQAAAVYGEANINYKKLQNEVNELAVQRLAEESRIVEQVRTSYAAAQEREHLMMQAMEHLKTQLGDVNERMVRYRVLKNEARANADLYNTLLGRLKEAGLYAGLKSSNIRVVDPASMLDTPTGPHRPLIVSMGAVLGGLFALLLAFARESMNNTVRTPDDVLDWTGLRSLAIVPLIGPADSLEKGLEFPYAQTRTAQILAGIPEHEQNSFPRILSTAAHSLEEETLRELRTSILLPRWSTPLNVVLITSPSASEGKSTVAINLAIALSERGRTCLVDGDSQRPKVTETFCSVQAAGWSDILAGSAEAERSMIRVASTNNLYLLPVGSQSQSNGQSVGSEKMKELLAQLRSRFEYVVIDSPPAIPFSDARVLAQLTDGVVLVGRYGLTTRRALIRCAQRLQEVGASIAGVVINGVDFSSPDYQYYNYGHLPGRFRDYKYYAALNSRHSDDSSSGKNTKAKGAGA